MSSDMFLNIKTQTVHDWTDFLAYKCCDENISHFAIIAKGNIIEGMEAET